MKTLILTKTALEKLQKEYDELILKRKEISEEIKKARGFGDLSENAEYHAAREAQSLNETEILKCKDMLDNHELVDETHHEKGVVSINSKIKILYVDEKEEEDITIVTKIESDPFDGKLSNESPIGEALLGKKAGNTIDVTTPNGVVKIKIINIEE